MNNVLAKKFSFSSLISFAMPNVCMMFCLSMYIIVDGMFISSFLGTNALSAANMIYPVICLEMAIAIMIATGGNAIIAKKLGEGNITEARTNFSFLILIEVIIGICISLFGVIFLNQILSALQVSAIQRPLCALYGRILFMFAPAFFLQTAFQTFFVTAGKAKLGFIVIILAGLVNMILDYIFMAVFHMGMAGAAIATGIGYCIPAIIGLGYFLTVKNQPLHFTTPVFDAQTLIKTCSNGSSEMVTNLANAVTTLLFNSTFLHFYGEDGVASITIILYFQYIFTALYFGYANGIAPIISFKFGNHDIKQLQEIFKHSMVFLIISSILSNIIIHFTISKALLIFTSSDSYVYQLAQDGFSIYSIAFLFMGLGIFSSALFTAFSDGKTSAIISFSRTFLFTIGAIIILPSILGEMGTWLCVPVAELLGAMIAVFYLIRNKHYGYA